MCLAVPGRIIEVDRYAELMPMADVSFGGVIRKINLTCTPDAGVGDWILVHAGFAINIIDEARAEQTIADMAEILGKDES